MAAVEGENHGAVKLGGAGESEAVKSAPVDIFLHGWNTSRSGSSVISLASIADSRQRWESLGG
jgi:hypothetical protein